MSRKYKIGDRVEINADTPALNSYGQSTGYNIDKYSEGVVTGYNDRYSSRIEDDYAKIKIKCGDEELKDKEVWIKSADFHHISIKY